MPLFKNIIPGPVASMMREVEGLRLKDRDTVTNNYQQTLANAEAQRLKAKFEANRAREAVNQQANQFAFNEHLAHQALEGIDTDKILPIKKVQGSVMQTWGLFCKGEPLDRAILGGSLKVFEYLLNPKKPEFSIDYTFSDGERDPSYKLALALKSSDATKEELGIYHLMVERILKDLSKISATDELHWILHAMECDPELINQVIPDQHGLTAAMQLAKDNHLAALMKIEQDISIDEDFSIAFDKKDEAGKTLLDHALQHGHKELSLWLLEKTALELSPIETASIEGNLTEVVRLLAINDGTVDPAIKWNAPLLWAVINNYSGIVARLIVSNRVDVTANDNIAVISAIRYGYLEIAKQLVDAGANIYAQHDLALEFAKLKIKQALNIRPSDRETPELNVLDFVYKARFDSENIPQKVEARTVFNFQYLWKNNKIRNSESKEWAQFLTAANTSGINASSIAERNEFYVSVTHGDQNQAETLLRKNRYLALIATDLTDCAGRNFRQITAFQYAIWALDYHMWTMIRKYLSDEESKKQIIGLNNGAWILEHAAQASWQQLIDALQHHVAHSGSWGAEQCRGNWITQIGKAQLKLPAHVMHEYHKEDGLFNSTKSFDEQVVSRTKITDRWFTYNAAYKLGVSGAWSGGVSSFNTGPGTWNDWQRLAANVTQNITALNLLFDTRTKQRNELIVSATPANKPRHARV